VVEKWKSTEIMLAQFFLSIASFMKKLEREESGRKRKSNGIASDKKGEIAENRSVKSPRFGRSWIYLYMWAINVGVVGTGVRNCVNLYSYNYELIKK
jgi:hypothetical protein